VEETEGCASETRAWELYLEKLNRKELELLGRNLDQREPNPQWQTVGMALAERMLQVRTREAAEKALPSLLGMAVDYRPGWDGHDARRKIGLLTEADVIGQRLVVRGYLYARDFPEVAGAIAAQSRSRKSSCQ
jgi:hypothetical protein